MSQLAQSPRRPIQLAIAAIVFLGFLGLLAVTVREWLVLRQEASVGTSDIDIVESADAILDGDQNTSPQYLIGMAEELVARGPQHDETARTLLKKALEIDEGRPFAWALLAFVETRLYGSFTPEAQAALQQSLDVCPFCEKDLLRWRLEFVISHWDEVPDDIRAEVFKGADFLRWWHMDHEFLQTQRERAVSRGIPFTDFQRAVNSRVRPEEIVD